MKINFKLKFRKALALLIIFQLLTLNFAPFSNPAYAASSPWTQTDWSGGSGQTSWSDMTKFDSASNIDATTTAGQTTLFVAEKLTNTGFASDNSSWSVAAVPPSGWVEVPGNDTFSTTNFLAMKYEAKCAATSDLTTGLTSPENSTYNTYNDGSTACTSANSKAVVSVTSGYPIANISHTNAVTRCSTVSLNGNAAHLLRNDEYMTIARNAEAQASNWTLGTLGSGYLFAGHNDNAPAKARIASTTDTGDYRCAYTDTAGTTENPSSCPTNTAAGSSGTAGNQVRTFSLSNGAVIWDIAGNVWEHVQRSTNNSGDDTAVMNPLPACTDNVAGWGYCQYGSTTLPYVSTWTDTVIRDKVGPVNTAYNSSQGVGQVYTYKNGTAQNTSVFLRGGYWGNASYTGAFTLNLPWSASIADLYVGFRCASDPVAISQSFSSSSGRSAAGGNIITIGSVTDGKIYQSVNVGDTSTYDISAYVYNNTSGSEGGTVDATVATLYYGGNAISSAAYTAVAGETGWYKLTGTVTGVASSVETGLLVKAGKTVKVDDFSLGNYNSSGTLTSSIFDTEISSGAAWGTLTYTSSGSTVTVKARTSDSSSMTGAADFSSCTAITSGSDISSNSCITDGHRYIQYQLSLSTADTSSTPTFSDISIAFVDYDNTAPTISLTALSPDPNSDNTPTLSGTATDAIGTVSNVQFQMDSTSGSWSSCTADDGSFDEATETFTCTPSALSDGSHTMYVRATDSNSNTTASGSYASDTFTIDTTAPVAFDLDSPGADAYINSERPTFKWQAATDVTSGMSSYTLEVDNGDSGDFSITGIPTSRTTDYETSKYLVHYDGFSDSDSANDYLSIYTKSSGSWGSGENDGKIKEGSRTWTVKAIDNAGNERSYSRVVVVDLTTPTLSNLTASDSAGSKDGYQLVTNQKPNFTGTITDNYSPDKIELSVYKERYFLGAITSKELFTSLSYSLANSTNQKSLSFSIPAPDSLDYGSYEVNIKGIDKAGNKSVTATLYLKVVTVRQARELLWGEIGEEEKAAIQEKSPVSLPRLEEKAKERREREAGEMEKAVSSMTEQFEIAIQNLKVVITRGAGFISQNLFVAVDKFSDNIQKRIVKAYQNIPLAVNVSQALRPAADTVIFFREEIGQRLADGGRMLARISSDTSAGFENINTASSENVKRAISEFYSESSQILQRGISNLAFGAGEKVQDVSGRAGFIIVRFGYLFVDEPTKIYDVRVATLSPTSAMISWKTNHPASGKVNYGLDESYPEDMQTSKRTTYHEFILTNLQPDTEYHFEVMSQNKNYVYDANRKFRTPKQ